MTPDDPAFAAAVRVARRALAERIAKAALAEPIRIAARDKAAGQTTNSPSGNDRTEDYAAGASQAGSSAGRSRGIAVATRNVQGTMGAGIPARPSRR
jgi:hypothetical protein